MFNPNTVDELVPDRQVRREVGGVSDMTIWRWDHDPKMVELGWPPPVRIRKRKFRQRKQLEALQRKQLEAFKANLLRQAVERRAVDAA
jgi:hypothetical protein